MERRSSIGKTIEKVLVRTNQWGYNNPMETEKMMNNYYTVTANGITSGHDDFEVALTVFLGIINELDNEVLACEVRGSILEIGKFACKGAEIAEAE